MECTRTGNTSMDIATDKLLLLQAFDSLFPIGAFALSSGLETYVYKRLISDKAGLQAYLAAYLHVLPYGDLGVAALAAGGADIKTLDELCHAMKAPREIREGSVRLCSRFIKAQMALGVCAPFTQYRRLIEEKQCAGHYPVAVGLFIRETGADLHFALSAYCYSLLSAAANHVVKLVPLRQFDGQAALREAMNLIGRAADAAQNVAIGDLGVSGCGFELRSMQHETLETRLYLS